ncbi:MAG: hypothetical protein ACOH18_00520 [Candidatus Saccharimonadaceae bacterium]
MGGESEFHEPSGVDDVTRQATRAAEELIADPEADEAEGISPAVRAHNEAGIRAEYISETVPKSINEAWDDVDESGKIRQDYEDEIRARLNDVSKRENDAIHRATHEAKLLIIKQIQDPEARAKAESILRVEEAAADSKRGRRW